MIEKPNNFNLLLQQAIDKIKKQIEQSEESQQATSAWRQWGTTL
jgi:hypothetical protein